MLADAHGRILHSGMREPLPLVVMALAVLVVLFRCWKRRSRVVDDQEGNEPTDHGILSRNAHLFHLKISERKLVLEKLFEKTTVAYGTGNPHSHEKNEGNATMNDIGDIESVPPQQHPSVESLPSNNSDADDVEQQQPQLQQDSSSPPMCSICWEPYRNGDPVMTGTRCTHLFHWHCCQAWLLHHDGCPQCRVAMMQPAEFRAAAVRVLGCERVHELNRPHSKRGLASDHLRADAAAPVNDDEDATVTGEENGAEVAIMELETTGDGGFGVGAGTTEYDDSSRE